MQKLSGAWQPNGSATVGLNELQLPVCLLPLHHYKRKWCNISVYCKSIVVYISWQRILHIIYCLEYLWTQREKGTSVSNKFSQKSLKNILSLIHGADVLQRATTGAQPDDGSIAGKLKRPIGSECLHCKCHSIAWLLSARHNSCITSVFLNHLLCRMSSMAQVPTLVAKLLFNTVQLAFQRYENPFQIMLQLPQTTLSSICIQRCQDHMANDGWL